ncbi:M28 family metallopeptidase [Gottschalkiaceae bacterium SANA]|nr:M28 family metallopeptidase [Gottschalkiaceae bacterium SANA]
MNRKKLGLIIILIALLGLIWIIWLSTQAEPIPDYATPSSSSESKPESESKSKFESELESPPIVLAGQENDFNEDAAFTLLTTLANDYEGRMAGTKKNQEVVELISEEFEAIGLQAPSGGYQQGFQAMVPIFGETFILEVKDPNGEIIKSYQLRKDFAFGSSYYAGGGHVESPFREIKRAADVVDQLIILHPDGVRLPHQQKNFLEKKVRAVIAPTSNPKRGDEFEYVIKGASIREPANKQGETLILGYVTPDVYEELLNFSEQGYRLHIVNDLSFETVILNNVVGMIPGTDPSLPALVISGHLDHVGSDPDGVIFPGALDNASGTSMVVQLARSMAVKAERPKRTLVFAAFNGEEVGLLGSIDFLQNPPIDPPYEVINFDMVGTDPSYPLSMDGVANNSRLLDELLDSAKEWDLPTDASTTGKYASDHLPFLQSGYNAFTIIQLDMQRIHTPDDDPSDIHLNQFDKIGEMMEDFLTAYAY